MVVVRPGQGMVLAPTTALKRFFFVVSSQKIGLLGRVVVVHILNGDHH